MSVFVIEIHDQPKGTKMVLIGTHTIMIFMTQIRVEVRVELNKGLGFSICMLPYFYFYQRPDSLVN